MLLTPAGGYHGHYVHGRPAPFRVGAAVESFSPPAAGHAAGGDPSQCAGAAAFTGPRPFAFIEPFDDLNGNGHFDPGEPFLDCNNDGRWDGNLIGGGTGNPRFYDKVADPVDARAMVVSARGRTIAVEVVDQEGLFNTYQARIRDRVAADGYHLDGVFISATHDESAPDSLGLGGVTPLTSGVNQYWIDYMVAKSAKAIEQAYRALRPARIRYTEVLEPANVRQCWSSYPYVDDQHMPVLEAVDRRGRAIVTLVDVSQHVETLGFNTGSQRDPGAPYTLDQENAWESADWVHFFRTYVEASLGGVAIEMAGSVGSNESPEVYGATISRTPQQSIDADHPAACETLFRVGSQTDAAGKLHVPLGYDGETRAFGLDMAAPVAAALRAGEWHWSGSNQIWGERADICVPVSNVLLAAASGAGVFAERPGYNSDCSAALPVLANGTTSGMSAKSEVAAFRIGDGEFVSVPGEVFPFTFLRGFQGPDDMPDPTQPLTPWVMAHMQTPFRFIDGLAEDMLGYIFPAGNAVGIPTQSNPNPPSNDRFGCTHYDDSESASGQSGNIIGAALVKLLDARGGRARIVEGRYVLRGGALSRDPLGGPELKCSVDQVFKPAGPAFAVELATGKVVHPAAWMSLSGLPQRAPDRDTRGYFDRHGNRFWLEVFENVR
jgi:hypothetical protein